VAGLGLPGRERGRLGGGSRALAPRGQQLDDGGTPPGERLDQLPVDPVDVRDAVDHRLPRDPEPAGQLVSQLRLVEDPGGLGVREQLPRVERAPDAVVDGAGEVGDQHVGVQQRIVRPRGAMAERRRDEPVHLDRLGPARPAAGEPGRPLQIPDRRIDRGVMRRDHLSAVSRSDSAHNSDTDFGARNV
jgi:hypothetical protein